MIQLRLSGFPRGANLGTVSLAAGSLSGSTQVPHYLNPQTVTGVPRINISQATTNAWSMDTTGLTGITAFEWQCICSMPMTYSTNATMSLTDIQDYLDAMDGMHGASHGGHLKPMECVINCDQGVIRSVPFLPYVSHDHGGMGMAQMASMAVDDAAAIALAPHHKVTHFVVADGVWSDPATWHNGRVPGHGARVLNPIGRTLTYDVPITSRPRLDWFRNDGVFINRKDMSQAMIAEYFLNTRGARWICGEPGDRISDEHQINFEISHQAYSKLGYEPTDLDLPNDPLLMGRGIINQGERVWWGVEVDPWLYAADGSAVTAGATSITLERAPVGWRVGDPISIAGTAPDVFKHQTEERVISAIDGAVVSWVGALIYDHDSHNAVTTDTDLQPAVANLRRNIEVRGERDDCPVWQQGHQMDMHTDAKADIWHVKASALGRTKKNMETSVGTIDANGDFQADDRDNPANPDTTAPFFKVEPLTARSNLKSRYQWHLHMTGGSTDTTNTYFGLVSSGAPGWGYVHHNAAGFMNKCVAHYFFGAGFVSETGDETGEWVDNLALKSRNRTSGSPKNDNSLFGDFARTGDGFFFRGRAIRGNGNVAMDCSSGHVFYHREGAQSISPLIAIQRANVGFKDLQLLGKVDTISVNDYPINHMKNNRAAGCAGYGLFVTKANPLQSHGLNIIFNGFKSFGCFNGAFVEYIGQYALEKFRCVGVHPPQNNSVGIQAGGNSQQVAFFEPSVFSYATGVKFTSSITTPPLYGTWNNTNEPRYILVAPAYTNCTINLNDETAGAQLRIFPTVPTKIEPSHNLPFKLGNWDGFSVTGAVTGLLFDSVGDPGQLPKPLDPVGMPLNGMGGSRITSQILDKGYWTVAGVPYFIFPLYFSDRIYATPIKTWHGLQLTGSLAGLPNNGAYTLSANPPAISPINISTPKDTPVTIDLLALASDADGGTLIVSPSLWTPDHSRLPIVDGVATLQPDPGYTGADRAWVWIEDGQGHSSRVDLNITVT